MPVSLGSLWNSLYFSRDQDISEAPHTPLEQEFFQEEATTLENEIPVSDSQSDQSRKPVEEHRPRTRAATNGDEVDSTGEVEQPNEGDRGSTVEAEQGKEENLVLSGEVEQADENDLGSEERSADAIKILTVKAELFDLLATVFGLTIPAMAIGFGYYGVGKCPANIHLPYMVFIIGLLSLITVCFAILKTSGENFRLQRNGRMFIEVSFWFLVNLWMKEYFEFICMEASSYNCDKHLRSFTMLMNLFLQFGFIIGFCLLYFDPDTGTFDMGLLGELMNRMRFEYSDSE